MSGQRHKKQRERETVALKLAWRARKDIQSQREREERALNLAFKPTRLEEWHDRDTYETERKRVGCVVERHTHTR